MVAFFFLDFVDVIEFGARETVNLDLVISERWNSGETGVANNHYRFDDVQVPFFYLAVVLGCLKGSDLVCIGEAGVVCAGESSTDWSDMLAS